MKHNLTGDVQLSSREPLDVPAAQVAGRRGVEGTRPAEPPTRHGGPEALAVGDGELLQGRAVRHPVERRSLRHERHYVASPSARRVDV